MFKIECHLRQRSLAIVAAAIMGLMLIGCGYSTARFLARGEEYLQKRKFHDALMQFRSAAESDPGSAAAHWGLARSYENLGQFNDALEEIRKTVELDDKNLDAKAKLGNYFLLVQPPLLTEAEKIQAEIVAADPTFVEGTVLKASILATRSRPDAEVVAKLDEAIAIDPKRVETYISLSRFYSTRDMADKAEAAILRGLATDPSSIVGLIEYGRFLTYAKRDPEADAQFARAVAVKPDSIEARSAQAEFYVTTGQMAKAESAYRELVAVQENSPESRLEFADFYASTSRPDAAISVLEGVIADSPEYVRARYRIGQLFLDKKDEARVIEQLDALFKLNDKDTEALMLRARLRMLQGKYDEAVTDLEDILKKQPSQRDALFYIAQAKLNIGQIDQARAFIADLERYHPAYLRSGLLKIQAAFAAGEPENALKAAAELYDRVNKATPNADTDVLAIQDLQIRALTARGLAYLELGKLTEAQSDLERVQALNPNSAAAMVNLAKVLAAQKNTAKAAEFYEKALSIEAGNFDAVSGITTLAIEMRQSAAAVKRLDSLLERNAGRADVLAALHYLRGQALAAGGDKDGYEAELNKAMELDPNYLPAFGAYAALLVAKDRVDEAIAAYTRVVDKKPSPSVLTLIGILEDSRGNVAAAERSYRRALEIAPDSAIAANNLAWLIAENEGNLDEALQLATLAVSRNQAVAGYYDTLGWVYLKKGLYSPAAQQFRKAIEVDEKSGRPANAGYRVRLGMALARSGDRASARREAEAGLRFINELTQQEAADAKRVLAMQ